MNFRSGGFIGFSTFNFFICFTFYSKCEKHKKLDSKGGRDKELAKIHKKNERKNEGKTKLEIATIFISRLPVEL